MALDTEAAAAWPRLRPGDVVRIVSPASTPNAAGVAVVQSKLESWGLHVQLGAHVFDEWGFCQRTATWPDETRTASRT